MIERKILKIIDELLVALGREVERIPDPALRAVITSIHMLSHNVVAEGQTGAWEEGYRNKDEKEVPYKIGTFDHYMFIEGENYRNLWEPSRG